MIKKLQIPKVALVNLCRPNNSWSHAVPQGALALATYLKKQGVSSVVYDTAVSFSEDNFTWQEIAVFLSQINEPIICISLWDTVLPKAILALNKVKEMDPSRVIVIGGPSVSASGELLLKHFPWIDYGCVGEGEKCLLELTKWIEDKNSTTKSQLPVKILFNENGRLCRGKKEIDVLENFDIPVLDYSVVDRTPYRRIEAITSRGCPFNCSFCSVHLGMGSKLRFRPLDHVFAEFDTLLKTEEYRTVHLLDDNFGTDKERFKIFCSKFRDEYPDKTWSCYFRLEDLTPANVELMASAGCIGVFVGVESGSEKYAKRLNKGVHPKEVSRIVKFASSHFNITSSFIWGFPEESLDDLNDSLALVDCLLDNENVFVNLYQLSPMAGTNIAKELRGSLAFKEDFISGVISDYQIQMTQEEIDLIKQFPEIFSSFYYQSTELFLQKRENVFKFLGLN